MTRRLRIKFTFLFEEHDQDVEWPWTDYISLAYVLNNPEETKVFNQGPVKVHLLRKGYFSLTLNESKVSVFKEVEAVVRDELSFQRKLECNNFCADSYPTLLQEVQLSQIAKEKKVYGEQHCKTICIAYDKKVSQKFDAIIGESCLLGSDDGSMRAVADKSSVAASRNSLPIATATRDFRGLEAYINDRNTTSPGKPNRRASKDASSLASMSGVRVTCLPDDISVKDIKLYFSKPENGGGKVKAIYYPLHDEAAVVLFDDRDVAEFAAREIPSGRLQRALIEKLPVIQMYTTLTAVLETPVAEFLQATPHVLEEIQYGCDITYQHNPRRNVSTLSGNWYQLEWAWKHVEDMMARQSSAHRRLASQAAMDIDAQNRTNTDWQSTSPNQNNA